MAEHMRSAKQWLTTFTVATSLLISGSPVAFAGPGDVNSVNNGQNINNGTYYNTSGNQTTFTNTAGTGIYLKAGDTLTGKEVNGVGAMTGNGGSILISAPNQVVRLDGNVNVNANSSGGFYLGNGGNVQINSAFLFQNGQITANGLNGGNVSFNVGSLTMGAQSGISATGNAIVNPDGTTSYGNGGRVNIKSPGVVDINQGAIIDVSGKTIGKYNTNMINIEGGLVNMDGVLTANGKYNSDGGTIKIAAVGATKPLDWNAMEKAENFISVAERNALMGKDAVMRRGTTTGLYSQDGNIVIGNFAKISANGSNGQNQTAFDCGCTINPVHGGNGGKITLEACKNIIQYGTVTANGGNAGSFVTPENGHGAPTDLQGANGLNGGNGGKIVFAYHEGLITRPESITQARGGNASNGQDANPMPGHIAIGGKGGDGGDGGTIIAKGPELTSAARATMSVRGGAAGKEGNFGAICTSCTKPGEPGAPGNPGQIIKKNVTADCPYCAPGGPPGPPIAPPVTPPTTPPGTPPTQTIFPKDYPQLGSSLPGNVGPLVNYNRAVYMARSPLPLEKRIVVPPKPAVVPAVPAPKLHKAAPPQRKIPVRGYW